MKRPFKYGDTIVMPEPTSDDLWVIGGFLATVIDVLPNGELVVEDQESNLIQVEPSRVELKEN